LNGENIDLSESAFRPLLILDSSTILNYDTSPQPPPPDPPSPSPDIPPPAVVQSASYQAAVNTGTQLSNSFIDMTSVSFVAGQTNPEEEEQEKTNE
jgi:hypothetical protein